MEHPPADHGRFSPHQFAFPGDSPTNRPQIDSFLRRPHHRQGPQGYREGLSPLHPAIPVREKNSQIVYEPHLGRHEIMNLTTTIIQFFAKSRHEWTQSQRNATKALRKVLEDWKLMEISHQTLPTTKEIEKVINLIGQVFFLGKLGPYEVEFLWSNSLFISEKLLGTSGTNYEGTEATIKIDKSWLCNIVAKADRSVELFAVLLHECIHAMLGKYGCGTYERRCLDNSCRAAHFYRVGGTGHGIAFVQIASYVEFWAREHLLSGVDLRITRSLRKEYEGRDSFMEEWDIWGCHWKKREPIRAALRSMLKQRERKVANRGVGVRQKAKSM